MHLSGPFSRRGPGHCPRWRDLVEASYPWPHWKRVRTGWYCAIGLLLLLSPVIAADMYFMIPSSAVFVAALGPLSGLCAIPATCLRCGGKVRAAPPVTVLAGGVAGSRDQAPRPSDAGPPRALRLHRV